MQGHVQVTEKMDQELEGLFSDGITLGSSSLDPFFQQPGSILDTSQDIYPFATGPAIEPGEQTLLGRMIALSAYIMELCGPTHTISELVGPSRDGRKRARIR